MSVLQQAPHVLASRLVVDDPADRLLGEAVAYEPGDLGRPDTRSVRGPDGFTEAFARSLVRRSGAAKCLPVTYELIPDLIHGCIVPYPRPD